MHFWASLNKRSSKHMLHFINLFLFSFYTMIYVQKRLILAQNFPKFGNNPPPPTYYYDSESTLTMNGEGVQPFKRWSLQKKFCKLTLPYSPFPDSRGCQIVRGTGNFFQIRRAQNFSSVSFYFWFIRRFVFKKCQNFTKIGVWVTAVREERELNLFSVLMRKCELCIIEIKDIIYIVIYCDLFWCNMNLL